jgi:hypothetical protein
MAWATPSAAAWCSVQAAYQGRLPARSRPIIPAARSPVISQVRAHMALYTRSAPARLAEPQLAHDLAVLPAVRAEAGFVAVVSQSGTTQDDPAKRRVRRTT